MTTLNNGQAIGRNQGKGSSDTNSLSMFLKVFAGEVIAAFQRHSVTLNKHLSRNIPNGKSGKFPVIGRTGARYLKQGQSLDDSRTAIPHSEKVIDIDGLLTSDVLIYDIEDAMSEFDVRAEYSNQLGEALAVSADASNLAEIAKLVNLDSTQDENIEGLGKPIKITIPAVGDLTTKEANIAYGNELIAALTRARAGFTKNYVPKADRVAYTHPDAYSAILAALMPTSANYEALIDPETGNIKNVVGFEVIETPHLVRGGDDSANAFNGVGHAYPTEGFVNTGNTQILIAHRSTIGTLHLKDIVLEPARRPEYQADQIIVKQAMGHGGLRPEASGAIVSASDAPASVKAQTQRKVAAPKAQ